MEQSKTVALQGRSSGRPFRFRTAGPKSSVPYTIGFVVKGRSRIRSVEQPTAKAALKLMRDLQASHEQIKFIKTPSGGEIGIGELEMLAAKEGSKQNVPRP